MENNYWTRLKRSRISRRRLLGAGAMTGVGLAAAALVGCEEEEPITSPTASPRGTPAGTATPAATPTPAIRRGGTMNLGVSTQYPTSFDPHKSGASTIRSRVNSRLFVAKSGPGISFLTSDTEGDAAESVEIPDPLTVTVKLKANVKFHPPISRVATADDVVYSFNRYVGNVPNVPQSPEAGETKRIFESWTALDARTVQFKVKQPQANVLFRLASQYSPYLMPKDADTLYKPDTEAMGTGAWIVEQAQQDVRILFRRNPEWHGGPERPYLNNLNAVIIREYATRLTQFLGGNLDDLVNVPGGDLQRIQSAISGVQFSLVPRGDPVPMSGIAFSGAKHSPNAPWRDRRVRQAVSMGIDRDAMTEAAYDIKRMQALGLPAKVQWNGFLPVALEEYWLDPKREGTNKMDPASAAFFRYDPDGAKRLLAEAGYPNGFNAKLFYTNVFGPGTVTLAELTVQYLSRIGINLTPEVADYQAVYVAQIRNKGEYDGLAFLPYGVFIDPGEFFSNMYIPGGNRNNSLVDDPDLTAKIVAIETDLNDSSRKQKILALQNELALKMYYVPMQAGAAPTVSAYQPHMRNVVEYQVWDAGANEPHYWTTKA